ncbi:MAG: DUF5069 domain-containing protein, partial [Candidatus Eremiobacteraeota bacterium]|nr:DUF5069 domain-containing protein [Candidatus Eremiobacteraeota bacterium]
MDLTTDYPRSVRDKVLGIVQLGRTIDKGKALAHGNLGEYHYNCPMDKAVFEFLAIDHEQLLEVIRGTNSDAEIEAYVAPFIRKKSSHEIETWNREWVSRKPQGESLEYFTQLRDKVAPGRTDVSTWTDLLDVEEGRDVPNVV